VTVTTVGSYYVILVGEHRECSYGNGFLTDVEVQKSAYLLLSIEACGLLFEASDSRHLSVQVCYEIMVHLQHLECISGVFGVSVDDPNTGRGFV
jgi:hypothetical protein